MAAVQTPGTTADLAWALRPSRPAGLYGELPPPPVQFAPPDGRSALVSKSRPKAASTD